MINIQPHFSVLIANYNNGKYLQEAIDSVLEQTYSNWEIILVDDASTDNSTEIYKKYETDNRFKIFYNVVNRGCGYTKRRCAELANGEICGFLDADDALLPQAIEIMVNYHIDNINIALVFSRYYCCDEKLNITGVSRFLEINHGNTYFTQNDYQPEVFSTFKKKFYKLTEGIASELPLGVDQDLYFKLEEVGGLLTAKDITYKYRIHDNSISREYIRSLYWNLEVRRNLCIRRGFDINKYLLPDFIKQIEDYANNKYLLGMFEKEIEIRSSRTYRVGKFIKKLLRIVSFQNKIIIKNQNTKKTH